MNSLVDICNASLRGCTRMTRARKTVVTLLIMSVVLLLSAVANAEFPGIVEPHAQQQSFTFGM